MRVGNHETVLVSLHDVVDPVDVTVKLKLNENGDEGLISESVVTVGEGKCLISQNHENILHSEVQLACFFFFYFPKFPVSCRPGGVSSK